MTRLLALAWDALAAWLRDGGVRTVEQLDERMLRDIGLEAEADLARERRPSAGRYARC